MNRIKFSGLDLSTLWRTPRSMPIVTRLQQWGFASASKRYLVAAQETNASAKNQKAPSDWVTWGCSLAETEGFEPSMEF